jgi:glycosyltransferase involved in cell wall biosynthesis
MKILITTGIYPPETGGPAFYAKFLRESLAKLGHNVHVSTWRLEKKLPTGIRHLFFLCRILPRIIWSDFVITLDTFGVGLPTVSASKLFGKKVVLRTGGAFLWEMFLERTKEKVLLRDFYNNPLNFNLNFKERCIFRLTRFVLQRTSVVVFSTKWQKDMFTKAYNLNSSKVAIIENRYGEKKESNLPLKKNFLCFSRDIWFKQVGFLKKVFENLNDNNLILETGNISREELLEKMKNCYAVILPTSLGDISPNTILEAISFNKPFILSRETGLFDRLRDIGLFCDPLNEEDIYQKILNLSDDNKYGGYVEKIKKFDFTHSYDDIASEFLTIYHRLHENS